jgi:hypothetical protein
MTNTQTKGSKTMGSKTMGSKTKGKEGSKTKGSKTKGSKTATVRVREKSDPATSDPAGSDSERIIQTRMERKDAMAAKVAMRKEDKKHKIAEKEKHKAVNVEWCARYAQKLSGLESDKLFVTPAFVGTPEQQESLKKARAKLECERKEAHAKLEREREEARVDEKEARAEEKEARDAEELVKKEEADWQYELLCDTDHGEYPYGFEKMSHKTKSPIMTGHSGHKKYMSKPKDVKAVPVCSVKAVQDCDIRSFLPKKRTQQTAGLERSAKRMKASDDFKKLLAQGSD